MFEVDCIVLYICIFPNPGDKTRPFTIRDAKNKTNTQVEIQNNKNRVLLKWRK